MIGVDVCVAIYEHLAEDDKGLYVPTLLAHAIARNVLGKKSGTSVKAVTSN